MDMILRTNHSKDIVEQFVKELEVQEQKVQHQEKIDLFESLDWEF